LFLYEMPAGKRYITDPNKSKNQSGQKGGTCAIYSSLFCPRYGKEIDKLSSHQQLTSLVEKRRIEKIISQYRKELNKLEFENAPPGMLKSFKKISKSDVNDLINEVADFYQKENGDPAEAAHIIYILRKFSRQNKYKIFSCYVAALEMEF